MFSKLQRWIQDSRDWTRGQNIVWPKFVVPSTDGLTKFQHEALRQLIAVIGPLQLQQAGTKETYLTGKLPDTEAVIFIYPDGAQIHDGPKAIFMAEREDHATPQILIQKLVVAAQQCAS